MPETKAFKYLIRCNKCNKPMMISELYFTAGTLIVFDAICVKCNVYESREADFFQIQSDIYRKLGTTYVDGNEVVQ